MHKRLFLISGSSGAGKSTTAAVLAAELGCSWLQVDATWLALRAAAPREHLAAVHLFPAGGSAVSPTELVDRIYAAAAVVAPAFEATLPLEFEHRDTLVAEGGWLTPARSGALEIPGVQVRPVLLHEDDPAEVLAAMRSRSTKPGPRASQLVVAEAAWLLGQRFRAEAEKHGVPVVAARPRDTLLARVKAAFGLPE